MKDKSMEISMCGFPGELDPTFQSQRTCNLFSAIELKREGENVSRRQIFRKANLSIFIALAVTLSPTARSYGSARDVPKAEDKEMQSPRGIGPSDRKIEGTKAGPGIGPNKSCWRPGLARNIGIAEQSCDTKLR
jgi:hypothetical protein